MKRTVDREKLERYRTALPHGGQAEAAEMAGVTRKSVHCFLKGEHGSDRIEFAILKVIKKHKEKLRKAQEEAGLL